MPLDVETSSVSLELGCKERLPGSSSTSTSAGCDSEIPKRVKKGKQVWSCVPVFSPVPTLEPRYRADWLESSHHSKFFRILLWILMVLVMAATPLLMHWSYTDETGKKIIGKYNPGSVHSIHFFISIIIGHILAFIQYGMAGLKACYNIRSIICLAPISILISIGEHLGLIGVAGLDPTIYSMLQKTGLAQTLVFATIFFKQRFSINNWMISGELTLIAMAFICHAAYGRQDPYNCHLPSLAIVVVGILLTTWAVTYADFAYKRDLNPLPIQMAIGRWSAAACSLLLTAIYMLSHEGSDIGFFAGVQSWDYKVIILVIWLILRDWCVTSVIKFLDAEWKTTGSATAVPVLYALEIVFCNKDIDITLLCLVFAMFLCVCLKARLRSI